MPNSATRLKALIALDVGETGLICRLKPLREICITGGRVNWLTLAAKALRETAQPRARAPAGSFCWLIAIGGMGDLGVRHSALILVPSDAQCVQDQMVVKGQVVGVQGHLECVSNISTLCEAPRFVADNAFAVRTGRIGAVLVFVVQHGLFGDGHKILLDSRSTELMVKIRTARVYHCQPH
jgi:hypothetical protein